MSVVFLRRRRLGMTSCREVAHLMQTSAEVIRNDRLVSTSLDDKSALVRWGCTSSLPSRISVINTARAIHQVNNKSEFRKDLDEFELCPPTFWDTDGPKEEDYPLVVRPRTHSQGRDIFVVNNVMELQHREAILGEGWYAGTLINKVAEYRVFVVQGRAVAVAEKTPGNREDVAWNVARGGRFDNVRWGSWPLKAVRISIEAFNLTSLDFGGVDVMVDADNNAYVVEINSAPSLTSPYRQSCMAKAFDYLVQQGKSRLPLITARGGYRKFIHPAVDSTALMVEEDN